LPFISVCISMKPPSFCICNNCCKCQNCVQNVLASPIFYWYLLNLFPCTFICTVCTKASWNISFIRSSDSPVLTHTRRRRYLILRRTIVSTISWWYHVATFLNSNPKGNIGNIQSLEMRCNLSLMIALCFFLSLHLALCYCGDFIIIQN
jgi:magnesium-transporting ATPase (P-type)